MPRWTETLLRLPLRTTKQLVERRVRGRQAGQGQSQEPVKVRSKRKRPLLFCFPPERGGAPERMRGERL